jgi:hypothetical protein
MDKNKKKKTRREVLSEPQQVIRAKQIYNVKQARWEDIKKARMEMLNLHPIRNAAAHAEAAKKLYGLQLHNNLHLSRGKGRKTRRRK